MELIKQPNGWTCGASCVCMVTGTTLEDFYAFTGHDGSGEVPISSVQPIGVRCFSLRELMRYLLEHDWTFASAAMWWPDGASLADDLTHLSVEHDMRNLAMLTVQSSTPGLLHLVLWDGSRVIDPLCPHWEGKLSEYKIIEWWPLVKLNSPKLDEPPAP